MQAWRMGAGGLQPKPVLRTQASPKSLKDMRARCPSDVKFGASNEPAKQVRSKVQGHAVLRSALTIPPEATKPSQVQGARANTWAHADLGHARPHIEASG